MNSPDSNNYNRGVKQNEYIFKKPQENKMKNTVYKTINAQEYRFLATALGRSFSDEMTVYDALTKLETERSKLCEDLNWLRETRELFLQRLNIGYKEGWHKVLLHRTLWPEWAKPKVSKEFWERYKDHDSFEFLTQEEHDKIDSICKIVPTPCLGLYEVLCEKISKMNRICEYVNDFIAKYSPREEWEFKNEDCGA